MTSASSPLPLALCIQPACLQHKYIRHANSSHIFERPERLRAVLLGFASALARLEAVDAASGGGRPNGQGAGGKDELAAMLSSLSLTSSSPFLPPYHVHLPQPPPLVTSGQILLHHPALQLAHSPPEEAPFPFLPKTRGAAIPSSTYLRDLYKWASEAVDTIKSTGCEIPEGLGLNPGDLYLGPGSIVAIEGSVQTVCQAVDGVCRAGRPASTQGVPERTATPPAEEPAFNKAFCAIRPPGHHCGEDAPSGFCYVNNVVVGALHGYLQHDIDRAIIIDFDLHHGNGTQALVMPLNAAAYAEDLAMAAGKPPTDMRGTKGVRRAWKAFYGSVHDIYSYPCEDGDLDLIKDASLSLAAHGQYIENIHLQPYANEEDFYERIYPKYLALLEKALVFMKETDADPERTIMFISAGFDACEHEHQGMQRHDRRVPVSFYSRYTRDLAAWADKHTLGKVVSVLEGGYGDRALTSAAMGHAIGLLGREGVPDWWTVDELALLERAVKKRRKGKLCALPPDLASNPHIARTHALLAHMEGSAPPETPAPSVAATPQARMTLRTRKTVDPAGDESPVPRRGGRTKTTPTDTPLHRSVNEPVKPEPVKAQPVKAVEPVVAQPEPFSQPHAQPVKPEPPITVLVTPQVPADPGEAYPSPESESVSSPEQKPATEPIILRIPRLTPSASPAASPPREMPTTPTPAPPAPVPAPTFTTAPQQASRPSAQTAQAAPAPQASAPARAPAPPAQSIPAGIFFRPQNVESVILPPTPARPGQPAGSAARSDRVPMPNFAARSNSGSNLTRIVPSSSVPSSVSSVSPQIPGSMPASSNGSSTAPNGQAAQAGIYPVLPPFSNVATGGYKAPGSSHGSGHGSGSGQ